MIIWKEKLGGMIMKLVSLAVHKLYGCFDYTVQFNDDVTFLYGMNGCGKTTILNITEAIITGQLYKLFDYKFDTIKLKYEKNGSEKNAREIAIVLQKDSMKIFFNHENFVLKFVDFSDELHSPDRSSREIAQIYFNRYPFLESIKRTFNYVYLPLNRAAASYDDDDGYYIMRRYRSISSFDSDAKFNFGTRDLSMLQIESLIHINYTRINSAISKINDDFRNSILKSLLEIDRVCDVDTVIKSIIEKRNSVPSLRQTQSAYLKMLKDLNLLSSEEEDHYNQFFTNFIKEFSEYQRKNFNGFPFDLILKFQEISKIDDLLTIAESMENKKALARKPIETFLTTINSFIGNSEDEKTIKIDSMGQVYFTTKYSKDHISIQCLSSGEKQLLTFFSNLIFNVKNNSSGIFVVDEPELSLHLLWQKDFVDKTLEINKNIQLIFATHAPEIVGKRRNKMYKLEKRYVGEN